MDTVFLTEWENYYKQNGILVRKHTQVGEEFSQIVISSDLIETRFVACHDNLGHQGRNRTTFLIKRRFCWRRMTKFIIERVQNVVHASEERKHMEKQH